MLDKLQALEDKYLDLEAKISDPDVIANQTEWQKYARAHAKLTDVVTAYREYKVLDKAREEAEEIIADGSDKELAAMAQEELKDLKPQLEEYEQKLKILLLPSDPNDDKNAIVEIRGGAGGEEAALFAGVLFRMYQHYAESRRWSLEIMDASPTELGGFKEIVFQLSGAGVYGRMKFESGVHRVQRVPETESQGRVQKSQLKNREKCMRVLRSRVLEMEQEKQRAATAQDRKSQVGTGDRSERIRTYNYPQGRITDHRIGLTLHRLDAVLNGDLDEVLDALITARQSEQLQQVK